MIEFTTLVAVDFKHLRELRMAWETWKRHRPELMKMPLLIMADGNRSIRRWQERLSFLAHPNARIELWQQPEVSQREKMLTSLVLGAAEFVDTLWYLKLDTDTVAVRTCQWWQQEWFESDRNGAAPDFISSPWGYTKPPNAIELLDEWAAKIPSLAGSSPLGISPVPGADRVKHPRIISWCFFGNSKVLKEAAGNCDGRLPVPSQDTFLWYWAARRNAFFRRVSMKCHGWEHHSRFRGLKAACSAALAG